MSPLIHAGRKAVAVCLLVVLATGLLYGCVTIEMMPQETSEPAASAPTPRTISDEPPLTRTLPSPYQADVQAYLDELRRMSDYAPDPIENRPGRVQKPATEGKNDVGGEVYICNPEEITPEPAPVGQFLALDLHDQSDVLMPGVFIQEDAFREGKLVEIPVARAPVTLSINLPVFSTSRTIQNPTSSAIRQAVSELIREADERLAATVIRTDGAASDTADVIPATIDYKSAVTYSFEHAMYEAGLSVGYDGGAFSAGLDAAYSNENMVSKKTIISKMVQPMYTISFVTDGYLLPADLFGADVTRQHLEAMPDMIGAHNQPLYIKSITYGRMLLFSVSSSEAASAEDVKVAVDAAYAGFSGQAEFSSDTREEMSDLQKEVKNWGGTQQMAFKALREGDFQQFFRPTPAGNAVPLFYTVRTLYREPIEQVNHLTYQKPNCRPGLGGDNSLVSTEVPFYLKSQEGSYTSRLVETDKIGMSHTRGYFKLGFTGGDDGKIMDKTTTVQIQYVVEPPGASSVPTGLYLKAWGDVWMESRNERDDAQDWHIARITPGSSDGALRYGERVRLYSKEDPNYFLVVKNGRLSIGNDEAAKDYYWTIVPARDDDALSANQ